MSDDQKTNADLPPYMVTVPSNTDKRRPTKKYVIIAVSVILTVVVILTAILVGVYLFYNAQKDILQFSLNVNKDSKQDVTSDPNSNVVQYHVQNPNYELWVINDFNRDIQTLKVQDKTSTVCYVGPLNHTSSLSPSDISNSQSSNNNNNNNAAPVQNTVKYRTSDTPIPDISFLSSTATGFCKGVSTYWVYPYCGEGKDSQTQRKRRDCTCYFWCCGWYSDGSCGLVCWECYGYC